MRNDCVKKKPLIQYTDGAPLSTQSWKNATLASRSGAVEKAMQMEIQKVSGVMLMDGGLLSVMRLVL